MDDDYNEEDLTEYQKEFISGMEYALDQIESAMDLAFDDLRIDDEMETFNKLLDEFEKVLTQGVQDYLRAEITDAIITFGDENACKEMNANSI